jgi:hypothetical protein
MSPRLVRIGKALSISKTLSIGKAFSNRFAIILAVLIALHGYGTPAAPKCDCPCAKDARKLANAPEASAGQITILWPRDASLLGRTLHSKADVLIDGTPAGSVDFDAPLTFSAANGPHKLTVSQKNGYLDALSKSYESQIAVSSQKPLYFQVVEKGTSVYTAELDQAAALALLTAAPKVPSGVGTIYLYWPKAGLSLGFLDNLGTDLPVYLDNKRVGVFAMGDYLMVTAPAGEHLLSVDMALASGPAIREKFTLNGGSTRYFHIEKGIDYDIKEDGPDAAGTFAGKGLKQRQSASQ